MNKNVANSTLFINGLIAYEDPGPPIPPITSPRSNKLRSLSFRKLTENIEHKNENTQAAEIIKKHEINSPRPLNKGKNKNPIKHPIIFEFNPTYKKNKKINKIFFTQYLEKFSTEKGFISLEEKNVKKEFQIIAKEINTDILVRLEQIKTSMHISFRDLTQKKSAEIIQNIAQELYPKLQNVQSLHESFQFKKELLLNLLPEIQSFISNNLEISIDLSNRIKTNLKEIDELFKSEDSNAIILRKFISIWNNPNSSIFIRTLILYLINPIIEKGEGLLTYIQSKLSPKKFNHLTLKIKKHLEILQTSETIPELKMCWNMNLELIKMLNSADNIQLARCIVNRDIHTNLTINGLKINEHFKDYFSIPQDSELNNQKVVFRFLLEQIYLKVLPDLSIEEKQNFLNSQLELFFGENKTAFFEGKEIIFHSTNSGWKICDEKIRQLYCTCVNGENFLLYPVPDHELGTRTNLDIPDASAFVMKTTRPFNIYAPQGETFPYRADKIRGPLGSLDITWTVHTNNQKSFVFLSKNFSVEITSLKREKATLNEWHQILELLSNPFPVEGIKIQRMNNLDSL